MALTLTLEDGTGLQAANSYADRAEGDEYHDGHVAASDWTTATNTQKEAALVMATRLIDQQWQFWGSRLSNEQGLQWPRQFCPDPDRAGRNWQEPLRSAFAADGFFPQDAVPKCVKDATIEMARRLLEADRTTDPQGEGIKRLSIAGAVEIEFDHTTQKPTLPREVRVCLAKVGSPITGSGIKKLTRA